MATSTEALLEPGFQTELMKIIDSEVEKIKLGHLQPGDLTTRGLVTEKKITVEQARKILNELTERGLFVRVPVHNPRGGGVTYAFRPVETHKDE